MPADVQGQSSTAKGAGMPGKPKRGGKDNSCLEELAASSLEAAWRFPPALRLFVLFLEAADSHRLNKSLLRQVRRCLWSAHAGSQMHISCTALFLSCTMLSVSFGMAPGCGLAEAYSDDLTPHAWHVPFSPGPGAAANTR